MKAGIYRICDLYVQLVQFINFIQFVNFKKSVKSVLVQGDEITSRWVRNCNCDVCSDWTSMNILFMYISLYVHVVTDTEWISTKRPSSVPDRYWFNPVVSLSRDFPANGPPDNHAIYMHTYKMLIILIFCKQMSLPRISGRTTLVICWLCVCVRTWNILSSFLKNTEPKSIECTHTLNCAQSCWYFEFSRIQDAITFF